MDKPDANKKEILAGLKAIEEGSTDIPSSLLGYYDVESIIRRSTNSKVDEIKIEIK